MSIRKRTWQNSNGETKEAWVVDYTDQEGKRRLQTFPRYKTAKDFDATTRLEIKQGTHTPESESPTVSEAAASWLKECAANGLERSTLAQYGQHVHLHIDPYIGDLKLARLTTPAVHDLIRNLRDGTSAPAGAEEGKKRSAALIRKVVTSLGSIIAHARERGRFAGANPVREISKGKRGPGRVGKRQKGRLQVGRDIPTPGEIRALVDAAAPTQRVILMVAAFCGLRASEVRGLRWADVDLKRSELHVKQRADRYLEIGPPKSEAGDRKIPVPPGVLAALREWKLICPRGELGLVFPTSRGKIQHHKNIVRDFLNPAMKAAGLCTPDGKPKYGMHSLRHFFASWLINRRADGGREMPLKAAQTLLGHGSITMTADVYGHLFPRGDDAAELAEAERAVMKP